VEIPHILLPLLLEVGEVRVADVERETGWEKAPRDLLEAGVFALQLADVVEVFVRLEMLEGDHSERGDDVEDLPAAVTVPLHLADAVHAEELVLDKQFDAVADVGVVLSHSPLLLAEEVDIVEVGSVALDRLFRVLYLALLLRFLELDTEVLGVLDWRVVRFGCNFGLRPTRILRLLGERMLSTTRKKGNRSCRSVRRAGEGLQLWRELQQLRGRQHDGEQLEAPQGAVRPELPRAEVADEDDLVVGNVGALQRLGVVPTKLSCAIHQALQQLEPRLQRLLLLPELRELPASEENTERTDLSSARLGNEMVMELGEPILRRLELNPNCALERGPGQHADVLSLENIAEGAEFD
jgi:hypothetical protein